MADICLNYPGPKEYIGIDLVSLADYLRIGPIRLLKPFFDVQHGIAISEDV
jgi:hypothetical protein